MKYTFANQQIKSVIYFKIRVDQKIVLKDYPKWQQIINNISCLPT